MKRTILLLSILLVAAVAILTASKIRAKSNVVWQLSEAPQIQLGVRDKYGELGSYSAKFIVKGPKGQTYSATKQVVDDSWGFVYFPENFQTYGEKGKYTWKCYIGGRPVFGGSFEITTDYLKILHKNKFY